MEHIKPSRGKKEKKRKLREAESSTADPPAVIPPAPEIASFVDVGLTTVTRSLECSAAIQLNESTTVEEPKTDETHQHKRASQVSYAAVFVARSGQPSVLNSHLPQMVAAASLKDSSAEPIRLVGLSKACQDRLSMALGIPRVSVIGIRKDAPNSKALVDFARQHVPLTEVPWLKEAPDAQFRDTKINTINTFVGQRQKGKRGFGVSEKP